MRRLTSVLALLATTSSCAVGPNYQRPEVKPPEAHRGREAKAAEASIAELPWWEMFQDPGLARCLKEALTQGYDVKAAMARIEQARAQARAAMWAFFPTFGGQVGFGGGQGFAQIPTPLPPVSLNGIFGAMATASWEADVWGRLRRQKEAADAYAQLADEDLRGVYVALVGDVASTYVALRTADLQLEIVRAAIQARQETTDFFSERLKGGVSNDLELARAQGNLADAQAQLADVQQAILQRENLLSYLLARPPGEIARGAALDALTLLPDVPTGLPSTLLERRPDLRAAEAELHAATAIIGVRIGDVLPKFALTGGAGMATSDLGRFADASHGIYSGFAGLNVPIPILGGAAQLNAIDGARARVTELVTRYRQAFALALREVSDALITATQLRESRVRREEQVAALVRAEELANLRYKGGIATYLEVVTAQEQRLLSELTLAQIKGNQHAAVIQLYRALGGGWQMKKKETEPEATTGAATEAKN